MIMEHNHDNRYERTTAEKNQVSDFSLVEKKKNTKRLKPREKDYLRPHKDEVSNLTCRDQQAGST